MNRNASSMICPTAIIKGNVTLGSGCILHPQASIIAEGGAIEIGDNNIIEEYAVIYFRFVFRKFIYFQSIFIRRSKYRIFYTNTHEFRILHLTILLIIIITIIIIICSMSR
eukprot:TRINITY_DN4185_c0_g1_i3.p1 TRINITY_DN4185_c0_g1~~TRINITY_DN4185_c0_g1_i3.p1  ORF type:complete len:111 (-),score=10.71 TRINITY_DN4185_c0_g1_i3:21-353(-)